MAVFQSVLALFLAAFVLTLVAGEPLNLNTSQFKDLISGDIPVFVKFFAPWCGHCKRLASTWTELSSSFPDTTILIAKVDCTIETPLCSEEGIKGYPTLKLYIGSKQFRYSGHRDLSSLESFVREHTEDTKEVGNEGLVELNTNTFLSFIERNGIQFINFYAPWCGHCQKLAPVWERLADIYKSDPLVHIGKVDCTSFGELCTKYGVQGYPTLLMFGGGIPLDKYKGERNLNDLNEFVREQAGGEEGERITGGGEEREKEARGNVREEENIEEGNLIEEEEGKEGGTHNKGRPSEPLLLTENDFDKVIQEGITFVKFFAPWCGHCKEMAGTWDALAKLSHATTHTTIAKVDCTVEKTLCERYKIDGYPTLLLFSEGTQKMEYNSARDLESLFNFLKEQQE